jgi:DNA-binding CsgD family transcriptional regulator
MSLSLSTEDVEHLRRAIEVIASPLDAASVSEWRGQVLLAMLPLYRAQAGSFVLPADGESTVTLVGRSSDYLNTYVQHQSHDITFDRWRELGSPSVMTTETLTGGDRRQYTGSDIYDLVYRPFAVEDVVALILGESDEPLVLATGRRFAPPSLRVAGMVNMYAERAGQPRMSAEGLAIAGLLHPLLQSSMRALQSAGMHRHQLDLMIDASAGPTLLCTAMGLVVHRNARAAALFNDEPLAARIASVCAQVARDVGQAAHSRPGSDLALRPFERNAPGARGAYVIRGTAISAPFAGPPHVIISIETVSHARATTDQVRSHHRMSRRQAEVALLLAEGRSNKEIAERLGISESTARRHTEAVFGALGVRSRAQVAARLMRGA